VSLRAGVDLLVDPRSFALLWGKHHPVLSEARRLRGTGRRLDRERRPSPPFRHRHNSDFSSNRATLRRPTQAR